MVSWLADFFALFLFDLYTFFVCCICSAKTILYKLLPNANNRNIVHCSKGQCIWLSLRTENFHHEKWYDGLFSYYESSRLIEGLQFSLSLKLGTYSSSFYFTHRQFTIWAFLLLFSFVTPYFVLFRFFYTFILSLSSYSLASLASCTIVSVPANLENSFRPFSHLLLVFHQFSLFLLHACPATQF